MSKLSDAADAVKRFAAQHQAILDIGNILGEIGSVEQAKEEADRAYAASSEKLATAQAQLAAAQKDHADLLEKTTKLAEDSNAEAARVVEAARYEAERIVQTAQADAENVRKNAADDVTRMRVQSANDLAEANNRLTAARAGLNEIANQVIAAKEKLEQTKAADAELREKAKQLLG